MPASHDSTGNGKSDAHLQHWFPVAFEVDLERGTLERVTVFDKGYVVFQSPNGAWKCLSDRCPHRAARLSDGQMNEGKLECLYHGWQFAPDGACTHIPQLPSDAPIPKRACLKAVPIEVVQGVIWIWAGVQGAEDKECIPRVPGLEQQGVRTIDFTSDLPYGQEALNENVLDFAHIHVAHHGVRGGGLREHAGPLAFDIEEQGALGFTAQFKSPTVDTEREESRTSGASVSFLAPGLVHYRSEFGQSDKLSGLALFTIPLAHDRCRLLYRAYSNHWPQEDIDRTRWREHIYQMDLLEQDMAVVLGQVEELNGDPQPLKETWLPLKSSDPLVMLYRKWIDQHALQKPGALGWEQRGKQETPSKPCAQDRLSLHTRHCSACRAALVDLRSKRGQYAIATVLSPMLAAMLPLSLALPTVLAGLGTLFLAYRNHTHMIRLTRGPLPTSKTHLSTGW